MDNTIRVISNMEFNKEVEMVRKVKTTTLRAIQERLHDLTALKLSGEVKGAKCTHSSPHSKVSQRIPIDIVVFDIATLMNRLGIDNEFDFWNALLRGASDPVFDKFKIDRICFDNDIPEIVEDIFSKIRRLSD